MQKTKLYKRGAWYWIYYREAGAPVRHSLKTKKKDEAEAIQNKLELDMLLDQAGPRIPKIKTEDYFKRFIKSISSDRRPATARAYDWALRRFFEISFYKFIGGFQEEDLEEFKAASLEEGLAPASINSAIRHIKAFFSQAERDGILERSPYRNIQFIKTARRLPTFWSAEEVRLLLEYLENWEPYILAGCLAALCGFRKGELGAALWQWFNWDNKTVTLSSREDFILKDWESRTVPLSAWALEILEPRRQRRGYVLQRNGRARTGPAFDLKKFWTSHISDGIFPGMTLQTLRSTFGSLYLQEGVSLSKIAMWLGHSKEEVTRRHYAALMAYDSDIDRLKS